MTLGEAYRVLELEPGASEEAVREARKTLAKVWHPDRYASDPALQAKAEKKLALINAAFEALRHASYPPAAPPPLPPPPRVEPAPIEFVTRRRLRPWVIVVLALALAGGAYLAVMQLAGDDEAPVARREPTRPGPVIVPVAPSSTDPLPVQRRGTFGLGSTEAEVRAAQGAPERITDVIDLTWYYAMGARVEFEHGLVTGWFEMQEQLHVALLPRDPAVAAAARQRGFWRIGSSKDDVLALQGTPMGIINVVDEDWHYNFGSTVTFDAKGRVTEYNNFDGTLKVGK